MSIFDKIGNLFKSKERKEQEKAAKEAAEIQRAATAQNELKKEVIAANTDADLDVLQNTTEAREREFKRFEELLENVIQTEGAMAQYRFEDITPQQRTCGKICAENPEKNCRQVMTVAHKYYETA